MRRTAAAEAIAAESPPSEARPMANAPPTTSPPITISDTLGPALSDPSGGGPTSAGGIGTGSAAALGSPAVAVAAFDATAEPNTRAIISSMAVKIFMVTLLPFGSLRLAHLVEDGRAVDHHARPVRQTR